MRYRIPQSKQNPATPASTLNSTGFRRKPALMADGNGCRSGLTVDLPNLGGREPRPHSHWSSARSLHIPNLAARPILPSRAKSLRPSPNPGTVIRATSLEPRQPNRDHQSVLAPSQPQRALEELGHIAMIRKVVFAVSSSGVLTPGEAISRAEAMVPVLAERAAKTEALRRLPY